MKKYRDILEALIFFGALAAFWEYGVKIFKIKAYLLPPISDVLWVGWKSLGNLWEQTLTTMLEVVIGFVIAIISGVVIAVCIYFIKLAQRTLYPLVTGLQSLPKVAVAPLMIIWFGYGMSSKVMMTIMFSFFPIVISTVGGLSSTPYHLEEHFKALRASGWTTFWRLRAPSALPNFIDGCKVALPLAVIGAIVGEFVGSEHGLGNLILMATASGRTDLMFATLLVTTLLSLILYWGVQILGKLVWWRAM
ncbi:MAG: ABC transporter permease [Desulfatiglandales bacterium]|jgi:NitT/TauT family transport system permease protein|nr:ABC transporter permease [Desulfatiglandales bacterium]